MTDGAAFEPFSTILDILTSECGQHLSTERLVKHNNVQLCVY